ncbi:MAG: protein translocase subunit SecD, partial [Vicinamibacteria bacterium]|nr:protein translocase subunit SecD [Vicinamibacteria bacterium]
MSAFQNPWILWLVITAVWGGIAFTVIRKELQLRALLYGGFLIACLVALWPPYDMAGQTGKIRLGLDLRGGMHLILKVETDDALNAVVDDRVQTVREELGRKGITFANAQRVDSTSYLVEGIEPARIKDAQEIINDNSHIKDEVGGWSVDPTGGRFSVKMSKALEDDIKKKTIEDAISTLEKRVNVLGVAEPLIARHGDKNDQILVQLPGVTDPVQAKNVIRRTAQLMLKMVEDSGATREALLQNYQGKLPENMEIVPGFGEGEQQREKRLYLVRRESVVTGMDIKSTRVCVDENNMPAVCFSLKARGAERFEETTRKNIGRQLAIILDGEVSSAPVIRGRISDSGQISSSRFDTKEAEELSKILRAGAMPATLTYLQELTVGASLGKDSIRSGVMASTMAMSFIALFMLVYYRLSGVNAIVALIANMIILLGAMAYSAATLTLPGIAGVILTIGVGVDTNVLVFERIREELRNGKTVKGAIANGFDR